MTLDPHDLALARARTYGLVAEVLLDGWTDRALAVVEGLGWSAGIPEDADRRAADHQSVFGHAVPPYESVFRSADGLLGGPVAAEVRDAYGRMGFRFERTDIEPDHAGLQCAALSFLCAAEADARRDGVAAERLGALQTDFLGAHLGRWVRQLHVAVARQGVPAFAELTEILVELVRSHLGGAWPEEPADGETLLDDPKNGLKDVAAYLLVPGRSGIWLGLGDIQRVAERAELACGFGRRRQMMESLWFSAVDHDRVPALVAALRVELDAWDTGDVRVDATRAMLDRLERSASELPRPS